MLRATLKPKARRLVHPPLFPLQIPQGPQVTPYTTSVTSCVIDHARRIGPHQIITERNRYVDARIQQRITELGARPATMGDGGLRASQTALKMPGQVTLSRSSLRVLEAQCASRAVVAERSTHGTNRLLNCVEFRRSGSQRLGVLTRQRHWTSNLRDDHERSYRLESAASVSDI